MICRNTPQVWNLYNHGTHASWALAWELNPVQFVCKVEAWIGTLPERRNTCERSTFLAILFRKWEQLAMRVRGSWLFVAFRYTTQSPILYVPSSSSVNLTKLSGACSRHRKSGIPGNRTQDLWVCIQELWLLDHRGGLAYGLLCPFKSPCNFIY
jgi:hypothetical protein